MATNADLEFDRYWLAKLFANIDRLPDPAPKDELDQLVEIWGGGGGDPSAATMRAAELRHLLATIDKLPDIAAPSTELRKGLAAVSESLSAEVEKLLASALDAERAGQDDLRAENTRLRAENAALRSLPAAPATRVAHSYTFTMQRDGGGILRRMIALSSDGGAPYEFTVLRDGADVARTIEVRRPGMGADVVRTIKVLDPALGASTVPAHPYAPGRDRFGRPARR